MSTEQQNSSTIDIGEKATEVRWAKEGNVWVWRTLFNEVTVRVVNEGLERQLSIHAKNELSRGQMFTLIPKYIIEDLYKEIVSSETVVPVELSEGEDESR